MKRGAPGPGDVKGGFVMKFMLLLDGFSVGGTNHTTEREKRAGKKPSKNF